MLWIGIAIVILTFWFIYKNYEARLVLVLSGVAMTILGQCAGSATTLETAANAFIKQLVGGTLVNSARLVKVNRAAFFPDADLVDNLEIELKNR